MHEEFRAPSQLKIALLLAAVMGLYIYNDYFQMYTKGTIADMMAGWLGPLGAATNELLLAVSILLAIPALMIFFSVALPAIVSRWLNFVLGLGYTAVEVSTFSTPHPNYRLVVALEILLTLLISWYALTWPKAKVQS